MIINMVVIEHQKFLVFFGGSGSHRFWQYFKVGKIYDKSTQNNRSMLRFLQLHSSVDLMARAHIHT